MMDALRNTAEELAIAMLQRVSVSIHQTPSHPLPFCPMCLEDEVIAQRHERDHPSFRCLRCSWSYTGG